LKKDEKWELQLYSTDLNLIRDLTSTMRKEEVIKKLQEMNL